MLSFPGFRKCELAFNNFFHQCQEIFIMEPNQDGFLEVMPRVLADGAPSSGCPPRSPHDVMPLEFYGQLHHISYPRNDPMPPKTNEDGLKAGRMAGYQ